MKLDLHVHSHVSDGRLSPTQVVSAALAGGLDVLALTDHDTVAGIAEARVAAGGGRLELVPGIEVSTRYGAHDLHVLGYWIDTEHPAIREHEAIARGRRSERMQRMVEKLQLLGVRVAYQDVLTIAGSTTRMLGRPHLARALLAAGHVRTFAEAFDRYLGDSGPAFVIESFPSVYEAIELIQTAGGLAVWAHPPPPIFDLEIRHFAAAGLDGVECYRPAATSAESLLLEATTRELGLLVTGGSDWHGPHHPPLGCFFVRPPEVREFLETRQSVPLRR